MRMPFVGNDRGLRSLQVRKRFAIFRQALQQWRGLPILAVDSLKIADSIVNFLQADGVGIKHRPAAMRRESISVEINNVDVDGAEGEAFLQNPRAFIDERVDAALDDFLR